MKKELEKEIVRCTCGSWTIPKILTIDGLKIRGSVCPKCGETYLNGGEAMRLSHNRKLKDYVTERTVTTSGNSFNISDKQETLLLRTTVIKREDTRHMRVRDVIKLLKADGWYLIHTKGSHMQFKHPTKPGRVTIVGHPKDYIAPGTLNSILE
jgi:predicted RNA binding protein YcfA (HicA-like mRNA interferase family)